MRRGGKKGSIGKPAVSTPSPEKPKGKQKRVWEEGDEDFEKFKAKQVHQLSWAWLSSAILLLTPFIPLQQPAGRPEEAIAPSYVEGSGEVNLDDWDGLLKGSGTWCFYGSGVGGVASRELWWLIDPLAPADDSGDESEEETPTPKASGWSIGSIFSGLTNRVGTLWTLSCPISHTFFLPSLLNTPTQPPSDTHQGWSRACACQVQRKSDWKERGRRDFRRAVRVSLQEFGRKDYVLFQTYPDWSQIHDGGTYCCVNRTITHILTFLLPPHVGSLDEDIDPKEADPITPRGLQGQQGRRKALHHRHGWRQRSRKINKSGQGVLLSITATTQSDGICFSDYCFILNS